MIRAFVIARSCALTVADAATNTSNNTQQTPSILFIDQLHQPLAVIS
jgi:hypothetical protein